MRFLNRVLLPQFLKSETHLHHYHSRAEKPNDILKGFMKSRSTQKALLLFRSLWRKGSSSIDSFSLLFVLKSCTLKPCREHRQFHGLIVNMGFERVIFLQSTLMNMYSAIGSLEDARKVFDEIPLRNVVCWTSLISAYVDNGKPSKALKLFRQMQLENVEPDQVTITVALSACADLGALDMGEWIHAYVRRRQGFEVDASLNNALINMFAKCGDVGTARRVFDHVSQRDVTTWTSMIVGHAVHGQAEEALQLFKEMMRTCEDDRSTGLVLPNEITFIGVLIACSHAGLVEEGFHHLESMTKRYGLKPRISHYGCMVDLLCRAGLLSEAYALVVDMPIRPNAVVWRTLLGACSLQGNTELGVNVRRRLLELDPCHVGDDVTMSNTYAAAGMWDEKAVVRHRIKHRRAPGCSSVEVGSKVHEFIAADKSHPHWKEIYEALEGIIMIMKGYKYAPND